MGSAIAFLKWANYSSGATRLFDSSPLKYSSSQGRLHTLKAGDHLWLVSRCPDDQQYYFTACLGVSGLDINAPGSPAESEFGRFAIIADASRSRDLGKRMPAEGLLRAFDFESKKPIKFGASLGQSLQAIRFLAGVDELVINAALKRTVDGEERVIDSPFGLWTKCDSVFAKYFLRNYQANRGYLAFLLYDSPPVLTTGAPIFIHSDKNLRLLATFRESQYVAGHKYTVPAEERIAERERIWSTYRNGTVEPPTKSAFDDFWERQNGVRALFLMDNVIDLRNSCQFKTYGRALEWGYPIGVGYRYLSLSQCLLLLHHANVAHDVSEQYLSPLLIGK